VGFGKRGEGKGNDLCWARIGVPVDGQRTKSGHRGKGGGRERERESRKRGKVERVKGKRERESTIKSGREAAIQRKHDWAQRCSLSLFLPLRAVVGQ